MTTPLGKVRALGSAKSGTREFLKERMTGMALMVILPYLLVFLIPVMNSSYNAFLDVISSLWVAPALIAALLLNASHMASGMRVIIEDYIHTPWKKYSFLGLNWIFSWGIAVVSSCAVIKIMFANI
ncbi:succinate dehydrogenase, hydrophobic membrane anchor protein [Pararhizobium arenae]|uniref:succinate dehydrogenase, hydrophobic membrane anchor protein n=1 Tax=Pararhizobium arenae TaxID=1856850 RepID=UPI000AAE3196|nr:succinate dehydrogenase, hydrophobic membrane anchor protein [Pararhizobium arenae]